MALSDDNHLGIKRGWYECFDSKTDNDGKLRIARLIRDLGDVQVRPRGW